MADLPYYVSALLTANAAHWGPGGTVVGSDRAGQPATVRFGFPSSAAGLTGSDAAGFAPMTETQKTAVRQALTAWASVANLGFVETADASSAEIRYVTNRQGGSSAAYTYYPGPAPGGGVFLANDVPANAAPTPGSYAFLTLLHETGHALGLKHPGNYDARLNASEGPFLPAAEDNRAFSVMSYNRGPLPPTVMPAGPSIDDVAAIQYLYGANMATAPGNDAYALEPGRYRTVWDPNGINALDAGALSAPVSLDLRAGALSTVDGTPVLGLAHGTRVQRATGGSGDDTLVPNRLGDALDGGGGVNVAVFDRPRGEVALLRTETGAVVAAAAEGGTVLTNVQRAQFTDGMMTELQAAVLDPFDTLRYLCSNPDLALAFGADGHAATAHYLEHGVFEARALTSFDPYRYVAGYPDLIAAIGPNVQAAEVHYLSDGVREGRTPAGFDPNAYLAANPDLQAAFGANLQAAEVHYIEHGYREGRLTAVAAAAPLAGGDPILPGGGMRSDPLVTMAGFLPTG
ncbi:matrixin family metalloprotease [Azospirillum sp.]|uniref:matrixin family metalloprotease n=1 Tax=Azospirillum sp. TaxID=34012 RepID=UPI003D75A6AF